MNRHLLMVGMALSLSGCATSYPTDEIAKSTDALGVVTTTLETQYRGINSSIRSSYIESQVDLGSQIDSNNSALQTGYFGADSINARVAALKAVGRYATLLKAYAENTSPAETSKAAFDTVSSFAKLQTTLSGNTSQASSYAGPVGEIVTVLTRMAVAAKLRKDFGASVDEATPKVIALLGLLKSDAGTYLVTSIRISEDARFAAALTAYNRSAGSLSGSERALAKASLVAASERKAAAQSLSFDATFASAEKAVTALQKAIHSKPDTAAAITAYDTFLDDVTTVVAAVKKLDSPKAGDAA